MDKKVWHAVSWQRTVRNLKSDAEKGLTDQEAWARQKKFGKNSLEGEKPLSGLKIFFEQFKSPLIYILLIAGFIALLFREWPDATVILGAVFLNTLVGYFQESKASHALRALKKIVKIEARVIREGKESNIDSVDLVPGDIMVLSSGNKVPADGRLMEVNELKINEAPLTGEWLSAEKDVKPLPEDISIADRDNMVYLGSMVENGKGRAMVTAIGRQTEMGDVAVLVRETREEKTPLQKKLADFSKIVGAAIGLITFLIFFGGVLRGKEFLEMFMTSIAVAVAAIPEGLPVAMTVILAIGMQRILQKKGLVRKLVAAEILGSTTIAATDKTLTLTQGKMKVFESVTPKNKIAAFQKDWATLFKEQPIRDQILLIKIAVMNSEAFIENPDDLYPVWRVRGRPTDRALILAGAEVGLKKSELEKAYAKMGEILFSSQNKFIASLVKAHPFFDEGLIRKIKLSVILDPIIRRTQKVLLVSGAPEKILELSSHVRENGKVKKLDKKTADRLNQELENLTSGGLRVIASAYKRDLRAEKLEKEINNLIFVGFIGLKDPLRKEAKTAVNLCKEAGMKLIIVTGDHLLTAKSVGRELGLKVGSENVIEGKDLEKMSEEEFQERVKDINIYARVEPRHKLKIVEAWQERGEVVAMTGDGINDAPALKKADIGVALGSGTDVAKEVSDLVLLTDNFNVIPAAVEEGRAIVDNIRKVITYLVSGAFTETILVGFSIVFGLPLPVTAVQILWVNFIEDGLPGIALAFEPKEKDLMTRPSQGKNIPLLTGEMKSIIFIIGFLTDLILLGLFLWLFVKLGTENLPHIRTMIFVGLGISSFFYIFSCKSLRRNIWHINPFSNKFLLASVVISFFMLIAGVHWSVFQALLGTVSLALADWLILLGLAVLNIALIEAVKYYFITRHQTEL